MGKIPEDIEQFIIWLITEDEWKYSQKLCLWQKDGWASRSTNELYDFYSLNWHSFKK